MSSDSLSDTTWQVLRATSHRRMPWKNGGGTTIEIAIDPPQASLNDFSWRISMAHVETPGPFSRFEGVDRHLLLLEGRIDLLIDGNSRRLTPEDPSVEFSGEAQASADLLRTDAGAFETAVDFNVMVRKDWGRAHLSRVRIARAARLALQAGVALVLSRAPSVDAAMPGAPVLLGLNDALLIQCHEMQHLDLHSDGEADLVFCQLWRTNPKDSLLR